MADSSSPLSVVRRRLTRSVDRLRQNLDAVRQQVREALAQAVGRSVAEAVGEAVYDALLAHAPASAAGPRSARRSAEQLALPQRDWEQPAWQRETDDMLWSYPGNAEEEYDLPHSHATPEPDEVSPGQGELRSRRRRQALAAGVQAAAWWLRRQRRPVSLWTAFTVGAVAGLTVLVGPAEKTAALAASALSLASLYELVCSVSNPLATNVSSAQQRT